MERLSGHTEATGLLIDFAQEVYREVDVHPLDRATGPGRLGEVHVSRQVNAGVVHPVGLDGRECPGTWRYAAFSSSRARLTEIIRIRSPRIVMTADHTASPVRSMIWVRGSSSELEVGFPSQSPWPLA